MAVINRIAAFHDDMTAWRRDLHRHPELGFQERRTSALVADRLRAFGVDEVHTGIARTGVVGVIRGRPGQRAIGLRADMDALPIMEATGLPHASENPGVMHACGHDGHTAMLLGAGRYLAETRNFQGTVYVIFQPAEEGLAGGKLMVEEGLFGHFPVENVFGLHNMPAVPEGRFAWRSGPIMAACAHIEITVTGRGTHAAMPNAGIDPVLVAAHIVAALQSIVARTLDPAEAGVVSIAKIAGGDTYNVIPDSVRMLGTARWFSPEVGDALEAGVQRIATGVAAGFGARAEVVFERTYIATVNAPAETALTRRAAETIVGAAQVAEMPRPYMWGEDFAFMLAAKPGSYIMLGAQRSADDPMVHHPRYDFNDAILPVGASYWATLAEQVLASDPSA
jgi:hippurate hydrolase